MGASTRDGRGGARHRPDEEREEGQDRPGPHPEGCGGEEAEEGCQEDGEEGAEEEGEEGEEGAEEEKEEEEEGEEEEEEKEEEEAALPGRQAREARAEVQGDGRGGEEAGVRCE